MQVELFAHTDDLNTGQAIDRIGVMMGMQFPCGPELERLAAQSSRTFRIPSQLQRWEPLGFGAGK